MKIKLTRTYTKETTADKMQFLKDCQQDGDDQAIDEFFNIGFSGDYTEILEECSQDGEEMDGFKKHEQ